ncbi:GNAT family N-acetyltransferase [Paraburkholderia sp. BCC1876]|uniref:GNAT family N-acetyltransferase n=1 Tax=Paraburkholderia sp. BCC1876 TaxID=2676303 RepID=UPI001ABB1970|nr:GNAT family N-acetyltransferase [Paraburkholderia sp. BCC1876]
MNFHLTIRTARGADADILQSLYRQLIDDENVKATARQIQILEDDARTRLLVCEIDGRIRGTVLVCLCADAMYAGQPFAVVENLVVDQECRRNGIGRALLREVEQFCRSRDCSKIMLLSSAARVDAHRFFEQFGFLGDRKRGFVKYRSQFAETACDLLSLAGQKRMVDDSM